MAIRNDFTAGEVLAAADLNDTFASKIPYAYGTATPSTTVDGFVWYDENETPPAPKFWDGAVFQAISAPSGLVHIATESFSAVSSVSLNGVFTSAYENYFLTIKAATAAGQPFMRMRLRASGSDNTTANSYRQQSLQASSTTLTGSRGTNDFVNFGVLDTNNTHIYATVFNPQLAIVTAWYSTSNIFPAGNIELYQFAGGHNQTTSYDGFTIYPGSSTFTGTVRVYGYQNS